MTANSDDTGSAAIARAFVAARRSATPLADYPGVAPVTLTEAYRIQDVAIAAFAEPIAGWKIGRILPPHDAVFGCDRLAGPIFAASVRHDAVTRAMAVFAGGFRAVEAEFVFRLDSVDPGKLRYTDAEAAARVGAVHVGVEIASSPFAGINRLGPAVTVSDFGNNNGLVIGPEVADWQRVGIDDWTVTLDIDGVRAGSGIARAFAGGTLRSVVFLLELLAARGIAVPDGTWASSGAVSGVHEIAPGSRAVARFGDRFEMTCAIVAQAPGGAA